MTVLSHASYPSLLFIIVAKLFDIQFSLFDLLILVFFSILPDLDFLFHKFIKRQKYNSNFQHHKWFTHWPITYVPLLILLFFFPGLKLFLICYGLFSHLVLDTFLAGDGMMWFYPFSLHSYGEGLFSMFGLHAIEAGVDAFILLGWLRSEKHTS